MSDSDSEPTSPSEASSSEVEEVEKAQEKEPEDLTIEQTIKEAIHKSLKNIQGTGSFAVFEKLGTPPLPGLHLNQGGNIGLPLSDRDAQAIIAASHQAPFGKGEETIVDQSVRKTWELSPDNFKLTNPAWKPFVDGIVSKVSTGLGVDAAGRGVSAQLYKLLLYDEGALFKPHQDSEKAPGMFGTLVIALPSKHEGGAVEVTHAGQTKLFETSKFSEFEASYLAWFSDVTHEVKPVTSGHRLVLTYNLIHESLGPKDLAASSNTSLAALRATFRTWKEGCETREEDLEVPIATLLAHKYTEASLQFDGLKGKDKQVGSLLREVCNEFGFCFYLANFEKKVEGGCDENDYVGKRGVHEIDELCDSSTTLLKIVDLDGIEVGKNLNFDDELHMDKGDTFERVHPDEEEYSGYTGNEGVSTTHFYRRTLAIVMPKSHRVQFFLDPKNQKKPERRYMYSWSSDKPENVENPAVTTWLDQLSQQLLANSNDSSAREDLTAICQLIYYRTQEWNEETLAWKENQKNQSLLNWRYQAKPSETPPFSYDHLARAVTTTLELNDSDLFVKMFNVFLELQYPPLLQTLLQQAGVALARYDCDFSARIKLRLSKINAFHSRISKLLSLREAAIAEGNILGKDPLKYTAWADGVIRDALDSPHFAMDVAEDGAALVAISKLFEPKDIFKTILSTVKINIDRTPMVVAFLTGLFDAGTSGEIDKEVTRNIFRDVISSLAEQFSLKSLESSLESKRAKTVERGRYPFGPGSRRPVPLKAEADDQNSRNIATLFSNCIELDLTTELGQICEKLTTEVKTADVELFEIIYLPFLKQLSARLPGNNSSAEILVLFQTILSTYILRYVKAEPKPPNHWARDPITHCTCADHGLLNTFLKDYQRKTERFSMAKKRREHLESDFKYGGIKGMKTETDTSRSPHTLVATKTLEVYNDAHKAWQDRCMVARNHIKDIGGDSKLSALLGDKKNDITLLAFEILKAIYPDILVQTQPLGSSSSSGNRTLAPPKKPRKTPGSVPASAEVIELD